MGCSSLFDFTGERHRHVLEYVKWAREGAFRHDKNSSLMMLQRPRRGVFITNDPDYVPNIRRPRTQALLER
jgi:hypothetical protein